MIQRIQTIFLLLAIAALALFLFSPLIIIDTPGLGNQHITIEGWRLGPKITLSAGVYTILVNAILAGTAAGIALIAIFLFHKRKIQMAFCWFAIVFVVSGLSFVYYNYMTIFSKYDYGFYKIIESDVYFTAWNLTAVAAIVFLILAFIYIRKDEELLKSLDRLR